jgi:uncharacterized membrane protein (DUF2068 family)
VKRTRPFGVTVIALLQALSGLIAGGSYVLTASDVTAHRATDLAVQLGGLAIAGVGLLIAVGLWQLRRWAWIATMIWTGFNLATALLAYVNGQPEYGVMAVEVAVVFYLNQREVQRAFGQRGDAG